MTDSTYGGAYQKENIELFGRRRIYTDVRKIDESNVIHVLQESLPFHESNRTEIAFLLRYEKGYQPLKRKKVIRPDIDVQVADNIANQIVEFKLGYHWGYPKSFVQRGDRNLNANNPDIDDDAITLLNQMNESEQAFKKDQELARFIEITGIGYQMVDIKREYEEGGSVFDLNTLNPMYSFVVYHNDIRETPAMSVTYRQLKNGDRYFTCITPERRYEIKNEVEIVNGDRKKEEWVHGARSGEKNPFGKVPVVEFIRAFDRMGCFERCVSDIDALNIEVSDFCNATAQATQEIWWMNDADFPVDPNTGEKIKPVSGQWLRTQTTPNGRPSIQPLSSTFNYAGVQENIVNKRNIILQKCYVPLQTDPGGGSTATAMSMSSGWSAAEAVAAKQEDIIRGSVMDIVDLELIAIKKSGYLPDGHILYELNKSDIQPKFTRQKTFDLGTKTNAFVTLVKSGVNGRTAMQVVDLFPDIAQAWADSKETIELVQAALFMGASPVNALLTNDRIMSDTTDQSVNSPILDGMKQVDYSQGGDV